jgi:hypothetical protein
VSDTTCTSRSSRRVDELRDRHYLEARLKPRRGHKRTLGAIRHTMICALWHMLATGET